MLLLCCAAVVLPQVSKLEADADQLQSNFMQSQQTVKSLERRLAGMEAELMDQQQRVRLFLQCTVTATGTALCPHASNERLHCSVIIVFLTC